ncbi:hypothetical protein [Nonomuraea rhodomycinica]|uniref:Uncharacterized protein n=1 Tax=Nonomuraea rhodomycinica TaxID=1712872 RepID=A0A7Y6MF72_9ACTN|nr:hypothetical protein [Nonomuraea rhodomycinica]NUW45692.1 hypothetical protein [Nonomuraea rhodomycinica]
MWAIPEPARGGKGWVRHWNGRSWRKPALPFEPWAVDASERGGVWVVGGVRDDEVRGRPAMARWDGRAWHSLPVPPRARGVESLLTQVTVEAAGQVWMLGESWRICLDEEGEAICDEGSYVLRPAARGGPDRPTGLWREKDEALQVYRSTGVWETVARMGMNALGVNALVVADRGLWAAGFVSYDNPPTYSYGAVWRAER